MSNFLDEPLSDGTLRNWQVDALRDSSEKEKTEVTRVSGEYQDMVNDNLAEFMTCVQLREKFERGARSH